MVTFTVIVPTAGRATLARTLTVASQLEHGDELIVVRRDCEYGNESRDDACRRARGTHLLFIDDDDAYVESALGTIRGKVELAPARMHVFRMLYADGHVLWSTPELRGGNVGTPMVCVPNKRRRLGRWANGEGNVSDFGFVRETARLLGTDPVFHEDVVALVRP